MKKITIKKAILFCIYATCGFVTIFIGACSDTKDVPMPESAAAGVTVTNGANAESTYLKILDSALPQWDKSTINAVPEEAVSSSFLEKGATSLLTAVNSKDMAFREQSKNGNSVYSSDDESAALKVNPKKGYWKFVKSAPNNDSVPASEKLTDEQALTKAEALFATFGLPEAERGDYIAVGVGGADMGPDGVMGKPFTEARHVRLFREINGLRVSDSHLMATYSLDGDLFRAEVRWPVFKTDETAELISRQKIISDVAVELAKENPDPKQLDELRSALEYRFDEETGLFEPTLFVYKMKDDAPSPHAIRYSLTKGLWTPPKRSDVAIKKVD